MDKDQQDEKKLIQAAKKDLSNFNVLYEKYVKAVYRYSYHRLGRNKDLTEDVVSETFVKAIEKFESYNYRNKPFVVWLYTIAHNLIVDYYRSKKERNISLDGMLIPAADKSEDIIEELTKEDLIKIINEKRKELPDQISNIFTLRHTEDLSFKEIANVLGKTEGAVKMQYYRGLEFLKNLVNSG